jgi:hypothetical protein
LLLACRAAEGIIDPFLPSRAALLKVLEDVAVDA